MGLFWQVMLSCLALASCDCNYFQRIQAGHTYYIYNPEYPNSWSPGLSCYWQMEMDPGYTVTLNCTIEMIPSNIRCLDYMYTVGAVLDGRHCDPFIIQSASNNLLVSLQTSPKTRGGRVNCEVKTVVDKNCKCGWKLASRRRKRVVGGQDTEVNEYPMMASLVNVATRSHYCGATIISPRHLLTSARCVDNADVNQIAVVVGEHDFTTSSDTNATRLFRVDGFIIHPEWSGETSRNDIAIIKIDGTIQYNERVGPVCLPFSRSHNYTEGQPLSLLGWGLTAYGGSEPQGLQKVNVDGVNFENCEKVFGADKVDANEQICTYTKGKDSCKMDSGGPLLIQDIDLRTLFLAGIVSSDEGCASDRPVVRTRVSAYLDWIVSQTPGERYCTT